MSATSSAACAAETASASADAIVHVMLIGFHHKYGPQVEIVTPRLAHGQDLDAAEPDGRPCLPESWAHLPFLALPDGLHRFHQDTAYFTVPDLHRPGNVLYGVACAQQEDARSLANAEPDVTRNTVLKSVCVLSRVPLFGFIEGQIKPATGALFAEQPEGLRDCRRDLLENVYQSLTRSVPSGPSARTDDYLMEGLDAVGFVRRFRHKALQIFKLMLLEPRAVIYAHDMPTRDLANFVVLLASLYPLFLQRGFFTPPQLLKDAKGGSKATMTTTTTTTMTTSTTALTASDSEVPLGDAVGSRRVEIEPPQVSVEAAASPRRQLSSSLSSSTTAGDAADYSSATAGTRATMDVQSGTGHLGLAGRLKRASLPFTLCHGNIEPYAALQQLEDLKKERTFIVGATNAIFVQMPGLANVVIDLGKDTIEIRDRRLKEAMALTTEDLRFIDGILAIVSPPTLDSDAAAAGIGDAAAEVRGGKKAKAAMATNATTSNPSGWIGSGAWVRCKFAEYCLCLAATADKVRQIPNKTNIDKLGGYGWAWFQAWRVTWNYARWCYCADAAARLNGGTRLCEEEAEGHPCEGAFKATDVGRRLRHVGERMLGAKRSDELRASVSKGGQAVRSAWSSVRAGWKDMWATPSS